MLEGNCRYACGFINEKLDGVSVTMPEGTYMIFLDCTEYCQRTGKNLDEVLKAGWNVGVGWQDGRKFKGSCHIRKNLAVPFSRTQEACDRLDKYVFVKYKIKNILVSDRGFEPSTLIQDIFALVDSSYEPVNQLASLRV